HTSWPFLPWGGMVGAASASQCTVRRQYVGCPPTRSQHSIQSIQSVGARLLLCFPLRFQAVTARLTGNGSGKLAKQLLEGCAAGGERRAGFASPLSPFREAAARPDKFSRRIMVTTAGYIALCSPGFPPHPVCLHSAYST